MPRAPGRVARMPVPAPRCQPAHPRTRCLPGPPAAAWATPAPAARGGHHPWEQAVEGRALLASAGAGGCPAGQERIASSHSLNPQGCRQEGEGRSVASAATAQLGQTSTPGEGPLTLPGTDQARVAEGAPVSRPARVPWRGPATFSFGKDRDFTGAAAGGGGHRQGHSDDEMGSGRAGMHEGGLLRPEPQALADTGQELCGTAHSPTEDRTGMEGSVPMHSLWTCHRSHRHIPPVLPPAHSLPAGGGGSLPRFWALPAQVGPRCGQTLCTDVRITHLIQSRGFLATNRPSCVLSSVATWP